MKPIKLLLIDDCQSDVFLVRKILEKQANFVIEPCGTLTGALHYLASEQPDVILLDLGLPDSHGGLQTLEQILEAAPQLPIIVFTGLSDGELGVRAVQKGAQDYLIKDEVDFNLLVRSIRYAIERKRTEQALRESEKTLRLVTETIQDVFWMSSPKINKILYVSPAYEHIWGCSLESLQQAPFSFTDSIHPEDREQALAAIQRTFSQDTSWTHEYRIIRPDGSVRWICNRGFPIKDEQGQLAMVTGVATDITQHKQAEEALRRSEEKYRLLVNQIPAIVCQGYADGSIDFFDNKVEDLTGYRKEEFDARTIKWPDLILQEDSEGAKNKLLEALKSDGSYVREYRIKRKDGTIRWVQGRAKIFCNPAGRIEVIKGVLFDVTEQRQSEQNLKLLDQQKQLILDSAAEGIVGLDIHGKHVFVNPAAVKLLGFEAEELIGFHRHSTWHHSRADGTPYPEQECPIYQTLNGHVATRSEEVFWRKDGSNFSAEISSNPLVEDDRVIGAVVTFWDITERKKLEAQLLQAQKMEAVGRLAGGVAHDFNNMLATIMGYAEMMQLDLSPESPLHRKTEAIKQASARAASLTRQLLAFSRKHVQQARVLHLNAVIGEMEKMLGLLIGEDIELELNLEAQLAAIKADPVQMQQVLMNLVVNARDAMPAGGRLTIETANVYLDKTYTSKHPYVTPGPYVMLAVSDSGVGMDRETQNHIFEPFFTTKESGKRTGLGLSTVYGIVNQSQGSIEVNSEPGMGTTFKVYFPQLSVEVSQVKEEAPIDTRPPGTETILVVEDEPPLRDMICASLQRNGYKVLEAGNGHEALKLMEANPEQIHLMLTDVAMPNLSGRELAEKVAPTRPEMKVLFMSGYTEDVIMHRGVLEQSMHFLEKPFRVNVLLKKVSELLNQPAEG